MLISGFLDNPIGMIIFLVLLVMTISIHEYAHARVADELGDPTPRLLGRLTLDPRRHIDPWGMLLLLFVGFGWGRPVPFDPFNLKNPRRDAALISLAGPASNFFMAIASSILLRLLLLFRLSSGQAIGLTLLSSFIYLNIVLGIFNLMPFAPLDGFKIVGGILNEKQAKEWYSLERFRILFLLLFIFPFLGNQSMLVIVLGPVINFVTKLLIP